MSAYLENVRLKMAEEQFKRKPYTEKFIKDISVQDFKVAVSGVIVNKSDNSFLLDDGTGQIAVSSILIPDYQYLRVFGKVSPLESGFEIQSEAMQDLSKIDKVIHKKIKELLSKQQ